MIVTDFIFNSELANILVVKYIKIILFDTKTYFFSHSTKIQLVVHSHFHNNIMIIPNFTKA